MSFVFESECSITVNCNGFKYTLPNCLCVDSQVQVDSMTNTMGKTFYGALKTTLSFEILGEIPNGTKNTSVLDDISTLDLLDELQKRTDTIS